MKKIVILYNLNRHRHEYESEFDSEYTIKSLHKALQTNYEVIELEADINFNWINSVINIKPNLIFNICEGYNGPARESVYAAILEQLKINYSGPDSTNLLICHNKIMSKLLLKNIITVPKGICISNINEIEFIKDIHYPVIVKLNSEGSSMGMTKDSIVNDFSKLKLQSKKMLDKYNKAVLIEEYIEGIDISMIYVEGLGALGPCQVLCDSEFYDYEMKSSKDSSVNITEYSNNTCKLKHIVNIVSEKLDLKGYAKLDFRINDKGIYLIEVNAQVSFHPEGEFITCAKKDGYSFDQIVNHIVKNALQNNKKENSIGYKE